MKRPAEDASLGSPAKKGLPFNQVDDLFSASEDEAAPARPPAAAPAPAAPIPKAKEEEPTPASMEVAPAAAPAAPPAAAAPTSRPSPPPSPLLPREQLVALIGQLMARNGPSGMAMVQRKAAAGEGFTVRGIHMDKSILREALAKLSPSQKEQLATYLEQQAAAKVFTPEKVRNTNSSRWRFERSSVWACDYGSPAASTMVAAFDLDSTLILPRSTDKEFGCTAEDWRWWHDEVPATLRKLAGKGFKLVVLSNQSGLSTGKVQPAVIHELIDAVQASLAVPLLAMVAAKDDAFRKPRPGMWQLLTKAFNEGQAPSEKTSFFVGDAAGRPKEKGAKKDFSDSDLKFALNVGIPFKTPEEFFLGGDPRAVPMEFSFDPRFLTGRLPLPKELEPAGTRELVLLIGAPRCGKTFIAKSIFADHVRINQEELGNREKCQKACRAALESGKSVVVDNQNRDRDTREGYVEAAKASNAIIRAVHFNVDKKFVSHLDKYKMMKGCESIPQVAMNMYWSRFEEPLPSEGFSELITLTDMHFAPEGTPEDVALLRCFL